MKKDWNGMKRKINKIEIENKKDKEKNENKIHVERY
jgi:hypothetical protein